MKDEDLIIELKKGNTAVLKECYSYLDVVKNFVLKNSGDEDDAYDLFQDGLIVFYENVLNDQFNLSSKINTYLFSICRNIWFQKLRKRKIEIDDTQVESLENIGIEYDNDESEKDEVINLATTLIDEMGDPCKSVLNMYYFKKMSIKDIALTMDYSSENVAKVRKYKCMQRLKAQLEKRVQSLI